MQRLLGLLVLGLVCTLGLGTVGCSKKDKDKPAADKPAADRAATDRAATDRPATDKGRGGDADNVAVIEYDVFPTEVVVLKQGEKKDVELTRKGKDLKNLDLEVSSSDPKVHVMGGKFKDTEKAATVTIHADKDAPAQKHIITLKADGVVRTINVEVQKGVGEPATDKGATDKKGAATDKGATDKKAAPADKKGAATDKGATDKKAAPTDKGASNALPNRDAYVALGRDELQAEARPVSRREAAWFTREL